MIIIICSFPITAVINRGLVRNTYYQGIHSMVIFIILGVGADDIFVFIDGWRQTLHMKDIKDNLN